MHTRIRRRAVVIGRPWIGSVRKVGQAGIVATPLPEISRHIKKPPHVGVLGANMDAAGRAVEAGIVIADELVFV